MSQQYTDVTEFARHQERSKYEKEEGTKIAAWVMGSCLYAFCLVFFVLLTVFLQSGVSMTVAIVPALLGGTLMFVPIFTLILVLNLRKRAGHTKA